MRASGGGSLDLGLSGGPVFHCLALRCDLRYTTLLHACIARLALDESLLCWITGHAWLLLLALADSHSCLAVYDESDGDPC